MDLRVRRIMIPTLYNNVTPVNTYIKMKEIVHAMNVSVFYHGRQKND